VPLDAGACAWWIGGENQKTRVTASRPPAGEDAQLHRRSQWPGRGADMLDGLASLLLVSGTEGGLAGAFQSATEADKFRIANFHWDVTSARIALWVIVFGGIGQQLSSYTGDQAVVQRYMTTPDRKRAARSIWTNAVMSIFASILFFGIGTALFAFHRSLFDTFLKVIGLFMGVLGGLFVLGVLTRRANAFGALTGALTGAAVMFSLWRFTDVNGYLYTTCGITACVVTGYPASFLRGGRDRNLHGLTVFTTKLSKE